MQSLKEFPSLHVAVQCSRRWWILDADCFIANERKKQKMGGPATSPSHQIQSKNKDNTVNESVTTALKKRVKHPCMLQIFSSYVVAVTFYVFNYCLQT